MNNNIITGVKGFVAGNLKKYLIFRNKQVIGVSRIPLYEDLGYDEISIDIMNKSKSFIHLAGKAHDLKRTLEAKDYFKVNTELTKSLFDQFLISDCKVFIYMSSVKAVADVVDGVLTEDVVSNPISVYGKSKLAAEIYILSKKIPDNKRVYILRPCMIHGPMNKGNLNLLYNFVSSRVPWPLGAFNNQRSYCSVENLLFIIKELIENKAIQSGIYNVSDDKPLSTNKVILLIAKSLERNHLILKFPVNLVRLLSRLGDIIKLPLNSENLKKLTESYVVCNKKIIQAIGKKLPIRSEEGMLKTFESFNK